MDKLERKKSAGLKETSSHLNLEAHFLGFDINDEVLIVIENKKKSLKMELSKATGEPLEVDDSTDSPSIVNNNHVNKKKKSKTSMSSPEPSDVKNSRSNKRQKKENKSNDASESLELNVTSPLELTTPTFNLTSSNTRARRSAGRKSNVDISDAIFKLPFEYGWKRELVYRTSGESTIYRGNRSGDVYYYSPNNRKLRSLREIQEQLDADNKNSLTIDSFTFLKQPIGMNDRSKELIRDANSKLSKEDSFIAVRPKKSKTPVQQRPPFDYELSDDENNKSSSKMKIVFTNRKTPRSRSKKVNSETMNTSLSTPEYIAEDWQAIQSSVSPKVFSPKLENIKLENIDINTTNIKRRSSTSDGEVIMQTPCGIRCPNSDEPATLMCSQCLVYYHPACVNLNANLKIVGYVCINCRSTVRQRSRRVQSSHTVVVGATEPEQLRIEPIRIRQVHQASDTPNFFIDRTPISKIEESHYEIDEYSDESDSDIINTVICQGNEYKTTMVDGSFHEQYVYEMKQTRGPSLMTCVIQEPNNLDENSEMNGSLKEIATPFASMQSFNYMVKALRHVFKHLKTHELLSASRVCTAWHIIAMNKFLWQNVRLKNSMVYDWERFVDSIDQQMTHTLDTRRMLIPTKIEDFEDFWLNFSKAMKRAQKLKLIELYRCPTHVVEDIIYSLPRLQILNATSIKNPFVTKESKNTNDLMILNLHYLGQMSMLTELRLKGLTGIRLAILPSFKKLVNLNKLSLTSIKTFPNDVCQSLETITDNLEFFEIGDCDCLSTEFASSLKRFVNLKSLRLENCGRWESCAQDVFTVIRSLEKLTILELVNIEFSSVVEDELEKCVGIKALLIIPAYVSQSATTNCHLIDCLKKLSKTLTHLVWGLTHELLRVTDLFITQYQQNQHSIGYNLELSHTKETTNNIPILRTRKPRQRPDEAASENEKDKDKDKDKSDNVDILSVPALEKLLDTMMPDAKTKVIKVPFSGTVRVYLSEQFNDL